MSELSAAGKEKKTSYLDSIYLTLRKRITLLDYMPGEKLSEVVLAEEFGVSRTPIRSILNRLESEELVVVRQGVGTFVTAIDLESMAEVYQLRQELALLTARIGAQTPGKKLIKQMREVCVELRLLTNDADSKRRFAVLNQHYFELHQKIIQNQPLQEINTRLFYRTARVWIAWMPDAQVQEESLAFAAEVEQAADLLERGDIATFAHLYRCHIAFGFERLSGYACAQQEALERAG